MKITEKILFVLVMGMLVMPALQRQFSFIYIKPLDGVYNLSPKPALTATSWFNGEFQQLYDHYTEDHIGFRPFLVRLVNQVDFSLFRTTSTDGVVIGKNNYLFEYDYIRAYTGNDFIGDEIIEKRLRRVKYLQTHLKEFHDIDFVIVFEPGKASVYPEYIPDNFIRNKKEKTNYDVYLQKASEFGIRYIDYNQYFKLMKDTVSFPLYARYATHWSAYGMSFVADSLVNYIAQLRDIRMKEMYIDGYQLEVKPRVEDYDIALTMNLLFPLPYLETLAYPVLKFGNARDYHLPGVLVVGDSYYWNIFNARVPDELFDNQSFWYFGNLVYPETYTDTLLVHQLDLKKEVEKQEVIFLMVTERFLHKFDWSFVDNLYDIYGVSSQYDKITEFKSKILINSDWFDLLIDKARRNRISIAEALELEARYLFLNTYPFAYMVMYGVEHYENSIRNDAAWLENATSGAVERHLSPDVFIRMNADYMLKKNHPDAYETRSRIDINRGKILNDSMLLEKVRAEAEVYCLGFNEMLQIAAERMLE